MEFLSQDGEVGPEIINLLTQKLKKSRESVELLEQDNKRLRNGLKNVQGPNPTPKGGHKLEQDEVPLDYTCRAGICPSMDKLTALYDDIRALETQKEEETQQLRAETSSLQERLARTKNKYNECKAKLKECRKELDEMREVIDNPRIETADAPLAGGDLVTNTIIPSQEIEPVPDPPNPEEQWQALAALASLPWLRDPFLAPSNIRQLSDNAFLFIPDCTVFQDPSQDHAFIYLPAERCTPGSTLAWSKNSEFEEHMHQTRELFYRWEGDVWYAGSFQCWNATSISSKSYCKELSQPIKDKIIEWTFTIPLGSVSARSNSDVRNQYGNGQRRVTCFQLQRVGFNETLYNAMKDFSIGPKNSQPLSKKRKSTTQNSAQTQIKKRKTKE